jgi:hypothetical protein
VLAGPHTKDGGVLLSRPAELRRNLHRDSCRVPTDLTVQVKDQVHMRRYNAALKNISAGGTLIETEAPFDFSTTIEMTMSLPGESTCLVLCQVVNVVESPSKHAPGGHLYCTRFVGIDPDVHALITRFVWRRLRELYPSE